MGATKTGSRLVGAERTRPPASSVHVRVGKWAAIIGCSVLAPAAAFVVVIAARLHGMNSAAAIVLGLLAAAATLPVFLFVLEVLYLGGVLVFFAASLVPAFVMDGAAIASNWRWRHSRFRILVGADEQCLRGERDMVRRVQDIARSAPDDTIICVDRLGVRRRPLDRSLWRAADGTALLYGWEPASRRRRPRLGFHRAAR